MTAFYAILFLVFVLSAYMLIYTLVQRRRRKRMTVVEKHRWHLRNLQ